MAINFSLKNNNIQFILFSAIIAFLLASIWYLYKSSPIEALSLEPDSEQIHRGKTIYEKNCSTCHGAQGEGQNPNSPKGGINANGTYIAPSLNGAGHAWHHSNEVLFKTVKEGSIASDSPMRGFGDRLSDEKIVTVIQYFKSLWPEKIRTHHAMLIQ